LVYGLALHVTLRERCDEDFWRNPRTQEPIRIVCGRGHAVTAAEACADLGVDLSLAARRAEELVA
jgi:hypothetical protein